METKITPLQSTTIATITSYPRWYFGKLRSVKDTDKIRGDLALQLISESLKANLRVVIVDGHSSLAFQEELEKTRGIIVVKRKGYKRSPAKRLAIKTASKLPGTQIIVLTEAEKASLIKDCLPLIEKPIREGKAQIIIPRRQPDLFKRSYPAYMYESEVEGNSLYNEYLRSHGLLDETKNLDIFFGPRVIKNEPKVIALFMKRFKIKLAGFPIPRPYFDPEEYSDTSFFPVVLALKKGFKVKSIEVPFAYPALQKENEEVEDREFFIEKRRAQRLGLLVELTHFLAYLEKNPGSQLIKVK